MSEPQEIGAGRCVACHGRLGDLAFPYATRWDHRTYVFRRCGTCGATSIDPSPSDDALSRMYARSAYHAEFYDELGGTTDLGLLPEALSAREGGVRLLDFGCGNGAYLVAASGLGVRAEGVELDPGAIARAAADSGCRVTSLEEVTAEGPVFDLIHLGDVLEHLPRPAETMRSLGSLLKPGGVLLIDGPLEDQASLVFWSARAIGAAKRRLGRGTGSFTPFHLTRFDAAAQRHFFERVLGWTVERMVMTETGWPYLHTGATAGLASRVRDVIGRTSRAAAARGMPFGNRFSAIVRPSAAVSQAS